MWEFGVNHRYFFPLLDEPSHTQRFLSPNLLSHGKEPHLVGAALSRTWWNSLSWLLGLCLQFWLLPSLLQWEENWAGPSSGQAQPRGTAQGKQTTATKPSMEQKEKSMKRSCFLKVAFSTHENTAAGKSRKNPASDSMKRAWKCGYNSAWSIKTNKTTNEQTCPLWKAVVF